MEKADDIEMAPALISNKFNSNKQENKIESTNTIQANGNRKDSDGISWKTELVKSSTNGDDLERMHDFKKEIESKKIGNIKEMANNHRLMLMLNEMEHDKVKENHINKCNGDDLNTKTNGNVEQISIEKDQENLPLIEKLNTIGQDDSDSKEISIPVTTDSINNVENATKPEDSIPMDTSTTLGSSGLPLTQIPPSCVLSGSSNTVASGATDNEDLRNQLCSLLGSNAPFVTDKLTNTLQELAMAVKESPIHNNQTNTNKLNLFSSISATEKQSVETNEVKKLKQQNQKYEMAAEMEEVVSKKLLTVRNKLLMSRCLAVNTLAKEQLKKISNFHFSKLSFKKNGKYDKKTKFNNNSLLNSISLSKKLPDHDTKLNGKIPVPKQALLPFSNDLNKSKKLEFETPLKLSKNEALLKQEKAIDNTKYYKDVVHLCRTGEDCYETESSSDEESPMVVLKQSLKKSNANAKQDEGLSTIADRWCGKKKRVSRKWTWLQTQIADLESQIQNVAELRKMSVAQKNPIFVQYIPAKNETSQNDQHEHFTAARLLPVDSTKRRKIVQVTDDHSLLKKTVRSYPGKCEMCGETLHKLSNGVKSCTYNGRFHKAFCTLPNNNSNHCYLSEPKDMSLSSRLSTIMASKTNWHSLVRPTMLKETQKSQKLLNHTSSRQDYVPRKRKYRSSNKKSRTISSSSLHEESNQELFPRPSYSSLDLDGDSRLATPVSSRSASRSATPTSEISHRKKRPIDQSSSYDINNIIIPHGVTISRIEKLHYKEILTPSWRIKSEAEDTSVPKTFEKTTVEKEPSRPVPIPGPTVKVEDFEDTSDASYQAKHDRYEILEKRKFIAYLSWTDSKKAHTSRTSISAAVNEYLQNKSDGMMPAKPRLSPRSPEIATPKSRSRRASTDSLVGSKEPHATITPDSVLQVQNNFQETQSKTTIGTKQHKRKLSTDDSCWENRTFPLSGVLLEHLDTEAHVMCFHANHGTPKESDFSRDSTSVGHKRRYSRSSYAMLDDAEHSDGSVVSNASSAKKRRRKQTLSRANSDSSSKINQAYDRVSLTLERLADTLHQRNSGNDWDSSDTETASSISDDAGNIINDFEDPEWKFFE